MFENLTDKLSQAFSKITSRGVLNEKDIDDAMREIRVALLEADVSLPVVMDENNPDILDYKRFAENIMGKPIEFEHIGGATDSRAFAVKGSTVIMHSGTGEGMHASGEYVEIESVKQIADIQIKFLQHLAQKIA